MKPGRHVLLVSSVMLGGAVALLSLQPVVAQASSGDSSGGADTATSTPSCFDDVTTFPAIPAGFDTATASPSQLQEYGFPSPPPGNNPGAVAAWDTALADAKYQSNVDPECGGPAHTIYYTGTWAGHVVPYTYVGSETFTWSNGGWTQPSVPGNGNYTNWETAPDASFWTGLGVCTLLQAGADSIATSTPQYKFWMEDYSDCNGVVNNAEWWEGPAIGPGQSAYVDVWYQGDSETYFYLENETTGAYDAFVKDTPWVGDGAANFINELVGPSLPNFGTTSVGANYFGNASDSYGLTTNNDKYIMPDSDPTGVNNANTFFSQEWCNGCG
jgi:hypothetical protein